MQLSYWERQQYFNQVDVAIVGSGIVGLSSAIHLKRERPDWKIIVIERSFLPYGASTRNAGFACFGSVSELLSDLKNHTEEELLALVKRRYYGLKTLRQMLGDDVLEYEPLGGYEIFSVNDSKQWHTCKDQLKYLNQLLSSAIPEKTIFADASAQLNNFQFCNIIGMIKNHAEGQLNTGSMMQGLITLAQSLGIILINGLPIKQVADDGTLITDTFGFRPKNVLLATNAFAAELIPDLAVQPARAQVLITKPLEKIPFAGSFHFDEGYYYFRNVGNRILLGGARNIDFAGEFTSAFGLTDIIQNKLKCMLEETILGHTNYELDLQWSGIMGLGTKKTTIIKAIHSNVFCAVRMGGMGVAIGSLVGKEAAGLVISHN